MARTRFLRIATVLLLSTATLIAAQGTPPSAQSPSAIVYEVTDLNGPGGETSVAQAINDAGAIVGTFDGQAVIWKGHAPNMLETLAGDNQSAATDINVAGDIAGYMGDGIVSYRAVIWGGGRVTDLGTLEGAKLSRANAINAHGQIAGTSKPEIGQEGDQPVIWTDGQIAPLPVLPDASMPVVNGINDAGQIVGSMLVPGKGTQAMLWVGDSVTVLPNLPNQPWSTASSINASGQIAGFSGLGNGPPILWNQGQPTDLELPAGYTSGKALGINDAGQVVGVVYSEDGAAAVLWDQGRVTLLPAPTGATESEADDINASGQIVGSATVPTNWGEQEHAVLWAPVPSSDRTATPEASPAFAGTAPTSFYVTSLSATDYDSQRGRGHGPDINDNGQIATEVLQADGTPHAAVWEEGALTDLGTLPGDTMSQAFGINEGGQVVGLSGPRPPGIGVATLWNKGTVTELGTLGGFVSIAFDINAQGIVVGYAQTDEDSMHAFLWEAGAMTDLGTLAGDRSSGALGINDSNQIVGYSQSEDGTMRAVVWNAGVIEPLAAQEGDLSSAAVGINNVGDIVGWSGADDVVQRTAVRWSNGQIMALEPLAGQDGSIASDINDQGQIVGASWASSMTRENQSEAVLWDTAGIVNLGLSEDDVTSSRATAISEKGVIIGWGEVEFDQYALRWSLEPPAPEAQTGGTPIDARWCVPAGEDSYQMLSIFMAGVFQARTLLLTDDMIVVPSQSEPTGIVAYNPQTGDVINVHLITEPSYGLLVASEPANGNVIFIADGGEEGSIVGAVDMTTGQRVWTTAVGGSIGNPPVVSGDSVFVAADTVGVVAIDAGTGTIRWTSLGDRSPGPVIVVDDSMVVAGMDAGVVAAFDRATGEERWRTTVAAGADGAYDLWTWTGAAEDGVAVLATLAGEVEITGSALYALDTASGAVRWQRGYTNIQISSPVVSGGATVVADSLGNILAFDLKTGEQRWQSTGSRNQAIWLELRLRQIVSGNEIVAIGIGGEGERIAGMVGAFDVSSGAVRWAVAPAEFAIIDTSPAFDDQSMFIRGFNQDGSAVMCSYDIPVALPPAASPVATP